jgi:predicted Ser/Thr protein kinase
MGSQRNVELLQAEVDESDQSFFRLLVDGRIVKYVTVECGLYTEEDMCFGLSLISLLPEFPPGDWNDGLVARDTDTGRPHFKHVAQTQFPGVRHQWHRTKVDYLDIVVGKKLRTGIYEATYLKSDTVFIVKFARFDWEIQYLENETVAYEWIDGHGIGPRFLGHLTEDDRVIGFLMERITNAQHAGPNDLAACQQTLSQLHRLGVHHGDTNRFNFLIHGSTAVLIDFNSARKCNDEGVLREEFENLSACLQDTSERGGGGLLC